MLLIAFMPGERLRDYHLSLKGFTQHWRMYLILFALVMPLIFLASRTHAFQNIYPFYRGANRSSFDFWAWEVMYAAQFLSLEFFFRGFMLKALAPSLGVHAVWVMTVPYCMIHFGKTTAETLGANLCRHPPGDDRPAHAVDLGWGCDPHRCRTDHGLVYGGSAAKLGAMWAD